MPFGFAARGETPNRDLVSPCVHSLRLFLIRLAGTCSAQEQAWHWLSVF